MLAKAKTQNTENESWELAKRLKYNIALIQSTRSGDWKPPTDLGAELLIAWSKNTFEVRLFVKEYEKMEACCHAHRVDG